MPSGLWRRSGTIIDLAGHRTVEQLGRGTALSRPAGEDAAAVGTRAVAGDADAREQFSDVSGSFAIDVFNLAHCVSPGLVVAGDGMSRAGDLLLDPVRKALNERDDLCPASGAEVVPAQGDDDVGLKGGTAYWTESR